MQHVFPLWRHPPSAAGASAPPSRTQAQVGACPPVAVTAPCCGSARSTLLEAPGSLCILPWPHTWGLSGFLAALGGGGATASAHGAARDVPLGQAASRAAAPARPLTNVDSIPHAHCLLILRPG
jgi:hypothetical protein